MKLRPYQEKAVSQVFNSWAEGNRRVILQLATGGGKTTIFSYIAKRFVEQGEGAMAIAHRKELIVQGKERLELMTGLECGVIKAGFPAEYHKDLQMASIQSLSRRKHRPDIGLLIIDEAHRSSSKTYSDLINHYDKAYVLGVTATPCRTDGQGFKWLYEDLITGISPRTLIDKGYLSKFKLFGAKPISTKGVGKSSGDFNQDQLEERAMALIGDVLPAWNKYAKGKQTILFAVSVDHSKKIVETFQEAGIKAEHLDGNTPDKEREAIIERFRNKETTVLSNVMVLTEGFDVPGIEVVQVVRPTMSLVLHLQMLGRGLRPLKGKQHCTFIDHTDNWLEHGLPDEDREWSLDPISLRKTRYTQECPCCHHIFQPLSHEVQKPIRKFIDEKTQMIMTEHLSTCPNCLHEFAWIQGSGGVDIQRTVKKDDGYISEVSVDSTEEGMTIINTLIEVQQSTNKKKAWIFYKALEQPESARFTLGDWRYMCSYLGYKSGWAYKALQEAQSKSIVTG